MENFFCRCELSMCNYCKMNDTLWYFPHLERNRAEVLLKQCSSGGTFVVRESNDRKDIVLSVLVQLDNPHVREVKHFTLHNCRTEISRGRFLTQYGQVQRRIFGYFNNNIMGEEGTKLTIPIKVAMERQRHLDDIYQPLHFDIQPLHPPL